MSSKRLVGRKRRRQTSGSSAAESPPHSAEHFSRSKRSRKAVSSSEDDDDRSVEEEQEEAREESRSAKRARCCPFPGREPQMAQLQVLLAAPDKPPTFPVVWLFGATGSGKTTVLRHCLQRSGCLHVYLDCLACVDPLDFFHSLQTTMFALNDRLARQRDIKRLLVNRSKAPRITGASSLLETLRDHCLALAGLTVYLVLDNFGRLFALRPSLVSELMAILQPIHHLPAALRFGQSGGRPQGPRVTGEPLNSPRLAFVLVSEGFPERSTAVLDDLPMQPRVVRFPAYSVQQMAELLPRLLEPAQWTVCSPEELRQFVSGVVTVFAEAAGSVTLQLRILESLRPRFLELLERLRPRYGSADSGTLVAVALAQLSGALRQIGAGLFAERPWSLEQRQQQQQQYDPQVDTTDSWRRLSAHARLLLVSAFLASYNLPKEDERLFGALLEGGRRRRRRKTNKDTAQSLLLQGPKAFSIARLLAIFQIMHQQSGVLRSSDDAGGDDKVNFGTLLWADDQQWAEGQVPTPGQLYVLLADLFRLRLLAPRGGESGTLQLQDDRNQLLCALTLDEARQLAQSIGVRLDAWLAEFID